MSQKSYEGLLVKKVEVVLKKIESRFNLCVVSVNEWLNFPVIFMGFCSFPFVLLLIIFHMLYYVAYR